MTVTSRRVAVLATHPVQYQVPWFQALSRVKGLEVKVYYAAIPDAKQQGEGFGVSFEWDIPMFEGYEWEVLPNREAKPGLDGFFASKLENVAAVLRRDQPDVILLTGWQQWPLLQALFAAMRLRIPRMIRGDSNAMKPRPLKTRLLHRLLMHRYNVFLSVGKSNLEFYKGYAVKEERVFPVPHFIENERFLSRSVELVDKRTQLRADWSVPDDAICFLYVGKLNRKKRITDLLLALKTASRANVSIHLLVVGTGELLEDANRLVQEGNLPVTLAGFLNQSEIVQAYVASDCLVLPSNYGETWGLVVNEAMACGKPAIVSDRVGCGPDLVEDGITGYQFQFADVDGLADRMLMMASDKEAMRAMGAHAEARVFEHYSVEKAVEGTLEAIDYVLVGRS